MHVLMYEKILKKQKKNTLENITWFEMGQAKEVN